MAAAKQKPQHMEAREYGWTRSPRHSAYVAVVLVDGWVGIAANLPNSIPVAIAWWRVLAATSRR